MKSWESTLVGPDATLEQAVRIMDEGGLRIAVVVDESRRLLGTLTDGDVRRAILRHGSLKAPVSQAMCRTPSASQRGWGRERVLALMDEKQILHLPVVDHEGQVVGLDTLHGLLGQGKVDNPVFLMAGGFGTRMHPLTHDCPKPMLRVGGEPILERILKSFVEAGFHRFYVSTHYLPEMIQEYFGDGSRWGVSITYIHEESPLGTGGAIGLLPHGEIDLPLVVMNSDLLTALDYSGLLEFHARQSGAATMCVRQYEHQVPYGVVVGDGHRIISIDEKPTHKFFINAGIYVLDPELVHSVPQQTRIDMTTVLENAIKGGRDVAMFPVHEYWLDVGRMDDYKRAQDEVGGV